MYENPEALKKRGLNIFVRRNSPKKSIFIRKTVTIQINSITKSDALSTSTVPIRDSNEILSVFFSVPHLVISPIRGKAKFAKYPISTAQKTFFKGGLAPKGSINSRQRNALKMLAMTAIINDAVTQK